MSLGHRPKVPDYPADQALKVRFNPVPRATRGESESRFQRWRFGTLGILGRCPQARSEYCAVNATFLDKDCRVRRRKCDSNGRDNSRMQSAPPVALAVSRKIVCANAYTNRQKYSMACRSRRQPNSITSRSVSLNDALSSPRTARSFSSVNPAFLPTAELTSIQNGQPTRAAARIFPS